MPDNPSTASPGKRNEAARSKLAYFFLPTQLSARGAGGQGLRSHAKETGSRRIRSLGVLYCLLAVVGPPRDLMFIHEVSIFSVPPSSSLDRRCDAAKFVICDLACRGFFSFFSFLLRARFLDTFLAWELLHSGK